MYLTKYINISKICNIITTGFDVQFFNTLEARQSAEVYFLVSGIRLKKLFQDIVEQSL